MIAVGWADPLSTGQRLQPPDDAETTVGRLTDVMLGLSAAGSADEVLQGLTPGVRRCVPSVVFAGVYLPDRQLSGRAAYGDAPAQHLIALQRGLGEGPALDALAGQDICSDDLGADLRWPRLATVIPASLRAGSAVPLYSAGHPIAALVLLSDRPRAIDPAAQQAARFFAIHAGLALERAITVDSLQQAIRARETVGPAIGILSERYHIDAGDALEALRQASQVTNTKVTELATRILQTGRTSEAVARTAHAFRARRRLEGRHVEEGA